MNSTSEDWDQFLLDVGFGKEDIEQYMKNVIDTPEFSVIAGKVINIKNKVYYKARSGIHGWGVFAAINLKKGDTVGVAIGFEYNLKYRSYLGRFTNHSSLKNTVFKELKPGEVTAICIEEIRVGEEILVDYRDHWGKW
jgi:hypothetical protein